MSGIGGRGGTKPFSATMDAMLKQAKAAKQKMAKAEKIISTEAKDTRTKAITPILTLKRHQINPLAFDKTFQIQQDIEAMQRMQTEKEPVA